MKNKPTVFLIVAASLLLSQRARADAEVDALVARAAKYESGESAEPLRQLERLLCESVGAPGRHAELENALIRLLAPDAAFEAKRFVEDVSGLLRSRDKLLEGHAYRPEGGLALPMPYTVYERPTYSVVPSNSVWRDPARAETALILRKNEADNRRRDLWFPQVMRDARRIGEYYPGLSPNSTAMALAAVLMLVSRLGI